MESHDPAPLSLLSHCTACKSSCCKQNKFIATEDEHERIIQSGAADHFYKIIIPAGTFYLNDYWRTACGYLQHDGTCTIQGVKPEICQIYPIQDIEGEKVSQSPHCPIPSPMSSEFIEQARAIVEKRKTDIRPHYLDIIVAFDGRYRPERLAELNARVFAPPALILQ